MNRTLSSVYVIFMLQRVKRTGSVHVMNNAALSLNHCSRRKALSMKYFYYVSTLALVFRQASYIVSVPYYIVTCGLSSCTIFFHIIP